MRDTDKHIYPVFKKKKKEKIKSVYIFTNRLAVFVMSHKQRREHIQFVCGRLPLVMCFGHAGVFTAPQRRLQGGYKTRGKAKGGMSVPLALF